MVEKSAAPKSPPKGKDKAVAETVPHPFIARLQGPILLTAPHGKETLRFTLNYEEEKHMKELYVSSTVLGIANQLNKLAKQSEKKGEMGSFVVWNRSHETYS